MDAFYAAVEQRDRPELRGKPVIVGAEPSGRGVVSAASYEARVYGVRSAMPISTAARLCPHGAFLPVDMAKYQRVSTEIMAILDGFSPLVEPISVDEAFVDLTGTESLFGPPEEAVRTIKRRIREATSLTASAGLAPNKFLAKIASDLRKPDGLVVVPHGGEAAFLAPLAIARLWGVGKVMAEALSGLGITTIGQLQTMPRAVLVRRFGGHGAELHDLAFGRDDRPVEPYTAPKSMGAEETFEADCRDPSARLTLKLRFSDFHTITRAVTAEPTQDGLELYRRARTLLDRERLDQPIRLIGLSASGLGPAGAGQLSLLDPTALRRERLARVVDGLAARFGDDVVRPAAVVRRGPPG
jgi:DNA polymerase-4